MSLPSTRTEQLAPTTPLRAALQNRASFFAALAGIYAAAIVAATLTLNPYFAQTWDVQTFIQAAHRFLDGGNPFDLYAQSRAAQTWPYAYPPLHAFVTALALAIGKLIPILPAYALARVPTIVADVALAFLLHSIILKKSNDEFLARAAAMLWLFNPITFYDTAVQGHFESEWLVFVLLAYIWHEENRPVGLPAIALALAVLFKQVAIIFAIPIWISFIFQPSALKKLALSLFAFVLVVVIVCLPYLLYSNDFLYMNLTYVENVPVQTQSWLVAWLGITRDAPNALTSDFFLLRYQTWVTILAAAALSFFATRRHWNVYLTAALIAIAFFLTSKKVMGYYYVMLFPFLFVELLPRKRSDLAFTALVATTYISLSPYYAAWTNHTHWWIYAVLGIINSGFFVWLGKSLLADKGQGTEKTSAGNGQWVVGSVALFASALIAALLQPLIANNGSPIRAPVVAEGLAANVLVAFIALMVGIAGGVISWRWFARPSGKETEGHRGTWVLGMSFVFAPLFFSVYTLTKESTAILEIMLKTLGV
jgi:hypothetical protein